METKRNIQGYLECDGTITKITSLEDIKAFVAKFGKSVDEITEFELDKLTENNCEKDNPFVDDCGVRYYTNPLRVASVSMPGFENYKVREGTVAICKSAFSLKNNNLIKAMYLSDSVIVIGPNAFFCNRALRTLRLPRNLLKIGDGAFYGCCGLLSVSLPHTLRVIGAKAFEECSMNEMVIPSSVRKVGSHAFRECSKLKEVTFEGAPEEINSGIFDRCTSLEKVIVPKGSKDYFTTVLFPLGSDKIVEKL